MLVRDLPRGLQNATTGRRRHKRIVTAWGWSAFIRWLTCLLLHVCGRAFGRPSSSWPSWQEEEHGAVLLHIFPLYFASVCLHWQVSLVLRQHFVTFKQQSAMCLSLRPHRIALTIIIFIARAFISAGFQVAFVYTPEVCQYFNHLFPLFWIDQTWRNTLACCPIGFSNRKQSLGDGNLQCDGQDRFPDYSVCVAGTKKPQHQSDIRPLHMRCSASLPGSSVFVIFFLSGDAKDLGVFDPVDILRLHSAGWHCLPDAPHRDAG